MQRVAQKKQKRKTKRPIRRKTYVLLKKSDKAFIRENVKFIPSLQDYRGQERITSAQYGALRKAKAKLRHTENLKPLTETQAKHLKGKLVGGGVRAIRLRGGDGAKVVSVSDKGVVVTSNGRKWEYHPVSTSKNKALQEALIDAGLKLFARKKNPPWQLHLWTNKGRTDKGASNPADWVNRVAEWFNTGVSAQIFSQQGKDFIYGVAAMITDSNGAVRKPLAKEDFEAEEPEEEGEE